MLLLFLLLLSNSPMMFFLWVCVRSVCVKTLDAWQNRRMKRTANNYGADIYCIYFQYCTIRTTTSYVLPGSDSYSRTTVSNVFSDFPSRIKLFTERPLQCNNKTIYERKYRIQQPRALRLSPRIKASLWIYNYCFK